MGIKNYSLDMDCKRTFFLDGGERVGKPPHTFLTLHTICLSSCTVERNRILQYIYKYKNPKEWTSIGAIWKGLTSNIGAVINRIDQNIGAV